MTSAEEITEAIKRELNGAMQPNLVFPVLIDRMFIDYFNMSVENQVSFRMKIALYEGRNDHLKYLKEKVHSIENLNYVKDRVIIGDIISYDTLNADISFTDYLTRIEDANYPFRDNSRVLNYAEMMRSILLDPTSRLKIFIHSLDMIDMFDGEDLDMLTLDHLLFRQAQVDNWVNKKGVVLP